jgi:ubiquinone/menaquinone biosynthesis C-methylase UbiE
MNKVKEQEETQRIEAEYASRDSSEINKRYSFSNPAFVYHMQERERSILSMLAKEDVDLSGTKVLEVGCGTGHILQRFLEFGVEQAVGIDLMHHRLTTAVAKYPNVMTARGNGAEMPYRDGSFDLVMQFMCLSSVLDDEMRYGIAREMWRVLRPGGIILSYDMRPVPRTVVFIQRILRRLSLFRNHNTPAASGEQPATTTKPLDAVEIKRLFHEGSVKQRTVSLHLDFAGIVKRSYLLAALSSMVPCLRTHYLVTVRKTG